MNIKKSIMSAALLLTAAACWAQSQPAGKQQDPGQPRDRQVQQNRPQSPQSFSEDFIPPELIMQNQKALVLSDVQQKEIREIMKKYVSDFTDLQWQESAEKEVMSSLFKQEKIDEAKAVAQMDKLLNIENGIKRLRLSAMIKVKNLLTPEQQAKLRTLKKPMISGQGERRGPQSRENPEGSRDRNEGGNPPPPPPEQ
jgi:Spy/CpxP family protein refolding chaperone